MNVRSRLLPTLLAGVASLLGCASNETTPVASPKPLEQATLLVEKLDKAVLLAALEEPEEASRASGDQPHPAATLVPAVLRTQRISPPRPSPTTKPATLEFGVGEAPQVESPPRVKEAFPKAQSAARYAAEGVSEEDPRFGPSEERQDLEPAPAAPPTPPSKRNSEEVANASSRFAPLVGVLSCLGVFVFTGWKTKQRRRLSPALGWACVGALALLFPFLGNLGEPGDRKEEAKSVSREERIEARAAQRRPAQRPPSEAKMERISTALSARPAKTLSPPPPSTSRSPAWSPTTSPSEPRPRSTLPAAENGSYFGQPNSSGRPKTVHVRGYYRKDGTYVPGHYRASPRR